jgi:hypothetical protein
LIAADICRRLIRAGAQSSDEPCEFEQSLIDVVLPLDQYAMTQCRLAMLANALADEFFSGYVGFCSRSGHDISEVGGEVYRKSGRLWLAHFRRLAGRQLLSDGAERVDRQWHQSISLLSWGSLVRIQPGRHYSDEPRFHSDKIGTKHGHDGASKAARAAKDGAHQAPSVLAGA